MVDVCPEAQRARVEEHIYLEQKKCEKEKVVEKRKNKTGTTDTLSFTLLLSKLNLKREQKMLRRESCTCKFSRSLKL